MIQLEIAGQNFTDWTEAEVKRSLDQLAGTFRLNLTGGFQSQFPIKRGSAVKVKIDGTLVLTGYVDLIKVNYSATSHELIIDGRDRACDIVDSTIDGEFEFSPPITLQALIQKMLAFYKITGISVIDKTGGIDSFTTEDVISEHIGTTVFEAIESYCRLRQVFLSTDPGGNIIMVRADGSGDAGTKLAHLTDPTRQSNILSATITADDSSRFNRYVVWSQGNVSQLEGVTDGPDDPGAQVDDIVSREGSATDSQIRTTRVLNLTAEHASGGKVGNVKTKGLKKTKGKKGTATDILDRATWEANIRRARSLEYEVTVQGHTKTGNKDPWQIFELVPVQDDYADINAVMLIRDVCFKLSVAGGSTTTMTLVSQDAYTLQAEEDQRVAEANKTGAKIDLPGVEDQG